MIETIITSSVLIAALLLIRFLFAGKISRRMQYALWGVALLRLLLPFPLIESSISIMNTLDVGRTEYGLSSSFQPYRESIGEGQTVPAEIKIHAAGTPYPDTYPKKAMPLADILGCIWMIGSIATGLWFVGTNFVFCRRLGRTRRVYQISNCKLPVYLTEQIASPCLFGIFHPAVYLTPKAVESEARTRHVLIHELCHYRHGDHIWPVLRGLCLAIWWWNPLVWAAAVLSQEDSELACDEAVIRSIGEENRLSYGRTLIDMIAVKRTPSGLMCAATTMLSGKRDIMKRLNMIVKTPKVFIPAVIAVLLITAFCVGCTFTGASREKWISASLAERLLEYKTDFVGDNSKVGGLLSRLSFPEDARYNGFSLQTEEKPYGVTVKFKVDEETRKKYEQPEGRAHETFARNAVLLFALIGNVDSISFQMDDGSTPFELNYSRGWADGIMLEDVRNYAASVQQLQELMGTSIFSHLSDEKPGYMLMKLGRNGEVIRLMDITSSENVGFAEELVMNYLVKSAAWPSSDIKRPDECYLLRATYPDGNSTDYYAYLLDGRAVMQIGTDGYYSRIDDRMYEDLVKLAHKNTGEINGASGLENITPGFDRTDLDACVSHAILTQNAGKYKPGDFAAQSHVTLKVENSGNTVAVYAMAMYMEFRYEDGGFEETGGSHMPVAVTFEKTSGGEYALLEYWTPGDGSYYAPSIKEKFPPDIYGKAIDTQSYVMGQIQACYAQAIEYGRIDTDANIAKLLGTICSSPASSSRPGDYIDAHPLEYRALLYYGDYTLKYVFAEFLKGGQTGLEGHIMLSAMRSLIGEEDLSPAATGTAQEWFDEWYKKSQPSPFYLPSPEPGRG